MVRHLQGRKHCEAVATRLLLKRGGGGEEGDETRTSPSSVCLSGVEAAWAEFSTAPLSEAAVEPPDIGLALLTEAMAARTGERSALALA